MEPIMSQRLSKCRRQVCLQSGYGLSLIIYKNLSITVNETLDDICSKLPKSCSIIECTQLSQCIKVFKKLSRDQYIILLLMGWTNQEQNTIIQQLIKYHTIKDVFNLSYDQQVIEKNIDNELSEKQKGNDPVILPSVVKDNGKNKLLKKMLDIILEKDIIFNDKKLFTICDTNQKSMKDLEKERGSFVWTQSLRIIMIALPYNTQEAKRQMVQEMRHIYWYSPKILDQIKLFNQTYCSEDAIFWYTKPDFLSTIINQGLRAKSVHSLYIFRYFIFDLSEQLRRKRYTSNEVITVYRGTILSKDEIDRLYVGLTVACNSFFSTSKLRSVGEAFAGLNRAGSRPPPDDPNSPDRQVIFKIRIDLKKCPDLIVADVTKYSYFQIEYEFLFDFGTMFTITNIEVDTNTNMTYIEMEPCDSDPQRQQQYISHMYTRLEETPASILFGRMLAHLGEYSMAVEYFQRLLRVLPHDDDSRGNIHYQLGRMYRFLGIHQQALHYFRCALLLTRQSLPAKQYEYGTILAGMGTVYMELNNSKEAVSVLERASSCYEMTVEKHNSETVFHFNRLAYAYYLEKKYELALELSKKTIKLYQETMPVDHPGHAQAYHNMGLIYYQLPDYERALECFKEALRMREKSLAPTHPYVARTSYQIGLTYQKLGDQQLALENAMKAFEIQKLKLPEINDERVKTKQLIDDLNRNDSV